MKNKLLLKAIMCSRFAFYGFALQTMLFSFLVAANSDAQEIKSVKEVYIDVNFSNVTVRDALKVIEQKTNYRFSYDRFDLNDQYRINLIEKNISVADVLLLLSEKVDLKFRQINNYINISRNKNKFDNTPNLEVIIQTRNITGRVTSQEDSEGLPGVNVIEKGTSNGTVTNISGEYSLEVADGATLVFSSVGYKSEEMSIGNLSIVDLVMTVDVQQLDELVVVGYGTQRAGEITGSVSTASAEQLAKIPAFQASSAIKGLMSGVTITNSHKPGDNAIIRIRGLGTINNNDPLWIVDGVPGVSVPPEEIESISVLKDASSQAIYGARAANGVILVTTKSGRKAQKARIKVSARNGIVQNTTDFGLLNTQEYGEYLWLRAKHSGIQNYSHALYGNGSTPDIPEYILPARATSVDHSLYDNLLLHEDGTDTYLIMKANKEGTDWLSEVSRNAKFQQYGIDISGGSDATSYAFMGNYINQEGILNHTGIKRYSIRSNVSSNITNWLEIGERLGASVSNDQGRQTDHAEGSVISFTYRMQPIVPVYDVMGNFAGSRAPETGNSQSPAFILHAGQNDYRNNLDINGNIYAKASIKSDLTFQTLLGFTLNSFNSKQFNMVEVATSERGTYDQLIQNESTRQQWNWTNTLQYIKEIGQHNFDLMLGTEAVANEYKFSDASRSQFFSKNPSYMQLNVGERDITNNGSMSEWSLYSQFGRFNYNLAHKYILQATLRRDGSSRFGEKNRYGVFPAFSAGWRLSEESFMEFSRNWLDNLRIRVGWGTTGNDQIGNYNGFTTFVSSPTNSYYPISGSNTSATAGFYANAIGNSDAIWETTTTTNLGLDAVLWGRLNIALDLWNRKTRDMLYNKKIPDIFGSASAPAVNIGDMNNKGVDLNLKYQGTAVSKELLYDVSLNVSHYRNEITNLSGKEGEFLEGGGLRGHNYTRAETGTAYPVFYGFIVDGIFQTEAEAAEHPRAFGSSGTYNKAGHFKYRDINDDGVINDEDRTIIGSPHPDFTAGLYFNLEYKRFTLSTFLYSSYGNQMVNQPRRFIDFNLFSGNRSKRSLYESWGSPYLRDNAAATMPIVELDDAGSQYPSTYYVEDASYLRMENLMFGYNFPDLFTGQNNFQIYAQVTNLFTLTGYSGLDSEIGRGGMSAGVDAGAWPTPRQYLIGINIDF